MKLLALLTLVGCGFSIQAGPDAAIDTPVVPIDVPVTWNVDAMSAKAVPSSQQEWTDFLAAKQLTIAAPRSLWLMQETGGALADSIGGSSLAPLSVPSYRNTVVGWSRSAVGTVDTLGDLGFATQTTGNLNGTSYLLLVYVALTATPSTQRSLLGIGQDADHRYAAATAASFYGAAGSGVTPRIGSMSSGTTVHPVILKIDSTRSELVVYSDREKLPANWVVPTAAGPLIVVGNATSAGAAPARYLYGALWQGTAAEMSDANVKALLTELGWSVSGF